MITDSQKHKAMALRKNGYSIKQIAATIGSAQSSVSIWCRGIKLTLEQTEKLKSNTYSPLVIEKRRQSRLSSEKLKRDLIIDAASSEIGDLGEMGVKLVAAALYWGEGAKKSGIVQFTNGDPRMIELMMVFFRKYCKVNEEKFRAYIHIHEGLDVVAAERYWQVITGISPEQFYKTYSKKNISSKGTKTSLPFGVCDIYVMDAKLFYKLRGWADGIYQSVIS